LAATTPQVVGQAGDIEGFLDRDRQAEQRAALAAAERGVSRLRRVTGAVEIAHHDRIDFWIERLDASDDVIGKLNR
jgi:hypothetical protein